MPHASSAGRRFLAGTIKGFRDWGQIMDTQPLHTDGYALPAPSLSAPSRLQIIFLEVSTMTKKRREATDEDLELIEMRYRQALALMNLEELFAEGQLDCM
jgi:hypothetical protein